VVDETDLPGRRPRLLPHSRWAQVALLLLVLFALLRSVLWASVQPAFFAPDEDYHWNYINYLVVKHTVPSLNKGEYTAELYATVGLTDEKQYFAGPRTKYDGHPHQILHELPGPGASRTPGLPKPRPVLHPPAYYLPAAVIDKLLWSKVSVTRLTAMRWYSAALGALTVYFAYLLAAAILAREWQRLAAASLVSLQTILGFSASTLTNDVGVAAALTATMAWCAWMLRSPPSRRQGIGLGVLFSIAIMVKATMLSLIIVIAATLLLQWRTFPEARGELRRMLAWLVGIPLVLTGWWYALLLINTHSILGERGSLTAAHGPGPGISHAPSIASRWLGDIYRSYWFDYNYYEVRTEDVWFWAPVAGMVITAAGFVLFCARRGRRLFWRDDIEVRPVLLIVFTALVLLLPPWALDTLRGVRGLPFVTAQARFIAPAYPGLAVIAVLALRELTRGARRAFPIAVAVLVAANFVLFCHTWVVWTLERFYGPIHGHWLRALLHASYDKPAFITQWSLLAFGLGALTCFVAGYIIAVVGSVRERRIAAPAAYDRMPSSAITARQ
jgi:Dolichyl-phosphate-mannose-protein mannosyltransferase